MIRVVLVDDHRVVVEGLKLLLQAYPDVSVVGSAGDGAEGADLVISLVPDVVLMDLSMPGVDGIQATRRIVDAVPDTAVVVLTTSSDREMVLRSLDAGAVGYLMKDTDPEALHEGIQAAAAGGVFADVAGALKNLGYKPADAERATEQAIKQQPEATIEVIVRAALRLLQRD